MKCIRCQHEILAPLSGMTYWLEHAEAEMMELP